MRISRMPPWRHPAAAQQIARGTPQINAGVAVGVVNRSARGIYYWSVETASTVWLCLELGFVASASLKSTIFFFFFFTIRGSDCLSVEWRRREPPRSSVGPMVQVRRPGGPDGRKGADQCCIRPRSRVRAPRISGRQSRCPHHLEVGRDKFEPHVRNRTTVAAPSRKRCAAMPSRAPGLHARRPCRPGNRPSRADATGVAHTEPWSTEMLHTPPTVTQRTHSPLRHRQRSARGIRLNPRQ